MYKKSAFLLFFKGALNSNAVPHLDSYQHLILGGTEVVAFGQKDFPESPFSELSLQNNVSPLNVLHI